MKTARQLVAAQAIRNRLAPAHPASWLSLSDDEHAQRVRALGLASRRVDELTLGREVAS